MSALFKKMEHPLLARVVPWFCAVLCALGLAARVAPLFDQDGRLLRQFPTEDGYLMQTIARNMALGFGMSTAAGTIPTNGTQPLFTFISAGFHWIAGGDKTQAIILVQVFSMLIAAAAAVMLWRLGLEVFGRSSTGSKAAAVAAAIWFASANCVRHTMNGLETGLYGLVAVVVVYFFVRASTRSPARPWLDGLLLGILLGVAFWTRNDAVFLVLAACVARMAVAATGSDRNLPARTKQAFLMGVVSVAIASPWLIHNYRSFGHIMPISGQSESLNARLGGNLGTAVVNLTEYILVALQIPAVLEHKGWAVLGCGAILLVTFAGVVWVLHRGPPAQKATVVLVGLYAIFLFGFYGIYFGAGYFMSRYLFVLSPFLALFLVGAVYRAVGDGTVRWRTGLGAAAAAVALAAVVLMNARLYRNGTNNMHFQVVNWVQENVPADTWVGAVQTGTLGYYHDRTINLDGKVNPEALAAERQGRLMQYVVDSKIQYLADWVGILSWTRQQPISRDFTIAVEDHERNLGVLRRNGRVFRPAARDVPWNPSH